MEGIDKFTLIEIVNKLDAKSLYNFSQTSDYNNKICNEVIEYKKSGFNKNYLGQIMSIIQNEDVDQFEWFSFLANQLSYNCDAIDYYVLAMKTKNRKLSCLARNYFEQAKSKIKSLSEFLQDNNESDFDFETETDDIYLMRHWV